MAQVDQTSRYIRTLLIITGMFMLAAVTFFLVLAILVAMGKMLLVSMLIWDLIACWVFIILWLVVVVI